MPKISVSNISQTKELAYKIATDIMEYHEKFGTVVVAIDGEMGAGKTTFSCMVLEKIGEARGKRIEGSSPTFSIINIHDDDVAHADLYRLKNAGELLNTGLLDIIEGGSIIIIEWADMFKCELAPYVTHRIYIEKDEGEGRRFFISIKGE